MKVSAKLLTVPAALLAGLSFVAGGLRPHRRMSFRGKVVVITGASRGLGLVMARQFADEGARLALLARSETELHRAWRELSNVTECQYFPCDVSSEQSVNEVIASIVERFGTVDVLINDAGVIQVGPLETMSINDFKDAMNIHFFGPLYTTMAVLPVMRRQRSGRIVNVSSIGGKVSVPHLLPYTASKFALVGFSEGLRSELLKDNIYVTTVCPGLMRTGSHIQAYFKGQNQLEYAWFSTLSALPLISIAAEQAAKQILCACRTGEAELIITMPANVAARLNALFPEATSNLMGFFNFALPSSGGSGGEAVSGQESQSNLSPNILTGSIEKAAFLNNE